MNDYCLLKSKLPAAGALARFLGRRLMTVSSSRNIPLVASICWRACAFCSRSSLTLTILSSRVSKLRGRGRATASNTSGLSSSFMTELVGDSPVSALRASAALPSYAVVTPLIELRGESSVLMDDNRFSFLSIPTARAALPSSHAVINSFRSTPMESYWAINPGASSDTSFESSNALSDSSLNRWSLACSPRIPVDRDPSFRSWERQRSRPGVKGTFGVGGVGNATYRVR